MPHCEDKTDELNCDSNRTSTSVQEKTTSKAPVDFYEFDEDYEQDLLRQQSEILEHLKLLESQQSSDRFYHPKNFLEKFMQEEEESLRLRKKTTTRRLTKPSTLRPLFHGNNKCCLCHFLYFLFAYLFLVYCLLMTFLFIFLK